VSGEAACLQRHIQPSAASPASTSRRIALVQGPLSFTVDRDQDGCTNGDDRLPKACWSRQALQAIALLGPGVGWIQQRHPALGPQLLYLVNVLPHIGRFLGRDAPTMRQPPLHLPPAPSSAIPGPAATRRGWAGRCGCWAPTTFSKMACISPPTASWLNRSTDSNARCPLRSPGWISSMDTYCSLSGSSPISSGRTSRVMGPWCWGCSCTISLANASSLACRPDRSDTRTCLTATTSLLGQGLQSIARAKRSGRAKLKGQAGTTTTTGPRRRLGCVK
jgi:hypothetical protein